MTWFDGNAESNKEQQKESEAWTENILEEIRVMRTDSLKECLLSQINHQVVKRDPWMIAPLWSSSRNVACGRSLATGRVYGSRRYSVMSTSVTSAIN